MSYNQEVGGGKSSSLGLFLWRTTLVLNSFSLRQTCFCESFWCCPFTSPAFPLQLQNRIGSCKMFLCLPPLNYHNAQDHSDSCWDRWLTSMVESLRCCPCFSTILYTGFRNSFCPGVNLYEASEDTNMPLFLFLGAFLTRPQLYLDSYLLPTNLGRLCNIFVKIFYINILCVGWILWVLSFLNFIKICCELSLLGVTMAA